MRKVLSILVENTSGVLSHVSGLFSRRGYNIDSFSAGVTADPRFTRMTIVASGDELILEQIEKDGYTGRVDGDGILRVASKDFKSLKEMTGYIARIGYRGSWGTVFSGNWR